jgi:hypothetical protein
VGRCGGAGAGGAGAWGAGGADGGPVDGTCVLWMESCGKEEKGGGDGEVWLWVVRRLRSHGEWMPGGTPVDQASRLVRARADDGGGRGERGAGE